MMISPKSELRKVRSLEYVLRASITPRHASKLASISCNNLDTLSELGTLEDDNVPTSLSKLKLFQGSLLMIGTMAFLNFILGNCIMSIASSSGHNLDSHDVYGLLSTEVILPLSMLMPRSGNIKPKRRRKRSHGSSRTVLRSAAIASIIDLVGPILPFAGGIDLRRLHPSEIYEWIKQLIWRDDSLVQSPRGRSASSLLSYKSRQPDMYTNRKVSAGKDKPRYTSHIDRNRPLVLGASEPFLPIDDIAELNLQEVALVFQLSRSQDLEHIFNVTNISNPRDQVYHLFSAVQEAAAMSRQDGVLPATTSIEGNYFNGEIDASLFCAALRIFAEWRMLRTVPAGYKSYAVGMALGLKDVVQNIAKIEVVIRQWIHRKSLESSSDDHVLRGPTVRQLLVYERENNRHPNLPRLNGGAAIGLLWNLRQLLYQSAVFENILDTPNNYPDSKAAVGAAYTEVYGMYHGWAVQKIFNYSFRSAPEAALIFKMMDLSKLQEISDRVDHSMDNVECKEEDTVGTNDTGFTDPDTVAWDEHISFNLLSELAFWDNGLNTTETIGLSETVDSLNDELSGKSEDWLGKLMNRATKLVDHIDCEFNKIGAKLLESQQLLRDFRKQDKSPREINREPICDESPRSRCGNGSGVVFQGAELEMYKSQEMERHIRSQISYYLHLMKPITLDLQAMFGELNMNDPSKV